MALATITCLNCGKVVSMPPCFAKKRKFCSRRCVSGKFHHAWNGGKDKDGYPLHVAPGQSRFLHIQIVERVLGHALPEEAVVHHVDGNKANNEHSNIVVCENQAYHMLLHMRQRILKAGGDPDTQKICGLCKQLKSRSDFARRSARPDGLQGTCTRCSSERCRIYYRTHKPVDS